MSSDINMSLEDIIQKKKDVKKNSNVKRTKKKEFVDSKYSATDARNKIISKNRTQIRDAREKLAQLAKQRDARGKIELLRSKKMDYNHSFERKFGVRTPRQQSNGNFSRSLQMTSKMFSDQTRQVNTRVIDRLQEKKQIARKKFLETRSLNYMPKPIIRTIENDVILIDSFEDSYPKNVPKSGSKSNLNLKIIAHSSGSREKAYLMSTDLTRSSSPPRLTSILKKRPMAALRSDRKEKSELPVASEYRIIVSNLRNSVTGGDIQELFGDVGGLLESRLVRPGTAEVIYKKLDDAQKAVDLYHNRQLDGQAMNCLLVNPRPSGSSLKSNGKSTLPASSNSNVEPDLSTFHKVLFSKF